MRCDKLFNISNVFQCGRNNPDVSCERARMATAYNEYFTEILDTLNEYQDRHGQRLSSKKLREAVCCVMDEEEEEIEHNISNSQEGVDDISDSREGVDDRNDSAEQVGVTNDFENLVVDGSDIKSDPCEATHTTNRIPATDTTNRISERKFFPLFIIASSSETRSRASCGSPTFVATTVFSTRLRNQDIFSQSDSSTARRDRNAKPFDAFMGLSTAHTADKLKSVIGPATRVQGLTDSSDGLTSSHGISKVAADRVSEAKGYSDYIKNSVFETMNIFEIRNDSGTRLNQRTRPDREIS